MMMLLSKFCAIFEGVDLNPGYARGCGNEIKYILKSNMLAMYILLPELPYLLSATPCSFVHWFNLVCLIAFGINKVSCLHFL